MQITYVEAIYTFARRNLRYPILEAFDRPDASTSCAKRDCSTTAFQALQMLNSDLSYRCSLQLRDLVCAQSSPSKQNEKDDEAIDAMRVRDLCQRVPRSFAHRTRARLALEFFGIIRWQRIDAMACGMQRTIEH